MFRHLLGQLSPYDGVYCHRVRSRRRVQKSPRHNLFLFYFGASQGSVLAEDSTVAA